MDISFLLKGLIIGFSIAAPVGPMGVLCIQRTLNKGRLSGMITGLGVATADTTYGFIAGFGLTFIANFLISQQLWIHLIGGIFVIYLGIRTLLTKPAEKAATGNESNLIVMYASTYLLTLTNPLTILSFAAVFASLGVGVASKSYISAGAVVLGVFLGSSLWWFILSSSVSLLRGKLTPQSLQWVNRLSGLIIVIFGLIALLSIKR